VEFLRKEFIYLALGEFGKNKGELSHRTMNKMETMNHVSQFFQLTMLMIVRLKAQLRIGHAKKEKKKE